jgi:hypothetical protein
MGSQRFPCMFRHNISTERFSSQASLRCTHEESRLGVRTTLFDLRPTSGQLERAVSIELVPFCAGKQSSLSGAAHNQPTRVDRFPAME